MPRERTSIYLAADLAAAVKASGIPLAELVRRGLDAVPTRRRNHPRQARPHLLSLRSLGITDPLAISRVANKLVVPSACRRASPALGSPGVFITRS